MRLQTGCAITPKGSPVVTRGLVILHGAGVSVLSTDDASQDSSSGFPSPIRYLCLPFAVSA